MPPKLPYSGHFSPPPPKVYRPPPSHVVPRLGTSSLIRKKAAENKLYSPPVLSSGRHYSYKDSDDDDVEDAIFLAQLDTTTVTGLGDTSTLGADTAYRYAQETNVNGEAYFRQRSKSDVYKESAARELVRGVSPRYTPVRQLFKPDRALGTSDSEFVISTPRSDLGYYYSERERNLYGIEPGSSKDAVERLRESQYSIDSNNRMVPRHSTRIAGRGSSRYVSPPQKTDYNERRNYLHENRRGSEVDFSVYGYSRSPQHPVSDSSRYERRSHLSADIPCAVEEKTYRSIGVNTIRTNIVYDEEPVASLRRQQKNSNSNEKTSRSKLKIDSLDGSNSGIAEYVDVSPDQQQRKTPLIHEAVSPSCVMHNTRVFPRTDFAIDTDGYSYQCPTFTYETNRVNQNHPNIAYLQYDYGTSIPGKPVRILEEKECLGGLIKWEEAYRGYIAGHEWCGHPPPPPKSEDWRTLLFYFQSHE